MIKKLLQNLKDSFKKYITNHIGTNMVLLIISLLIILVDLDDASDFIQRLFTTLFLTAMFTLLGESYTKEKKKRYIIYGIGLIFSAFMSRCILEEELARYLLGIIFSLGFAILYLMANNSKESTNKYLTNTVTNLFKLGIVGSVLNIGIMLILGLISTLLIELDEIVFAKTEILVLVLYYIPALIISLENKEEENKFIYSVINYVALPLVSIATAIIYIYIAKLLITFKLPHTQTFAVNAVLLSFGIPIVLLVLSYDKDTLMTKVANILKKLYIPFIFLQIFSLSLRIYYYGMTTSRYFGIILIILGIVSLGLLNIENGKNYKYILLPCIALSIISFMLPYINIYDYPNYAQINRLKQIIPKGKNYDDLTKEEIIDVRSIYHYVNNEKYYPKYLSREKVRKLLYDYKELDYYDSDKYITYRPKEEKVDVSNYKEMEGYSVYTDNDDFIIWINGEEYDISEYCKKVYNYAKKHDDIDEYMEKNRTIKLDENTDLYITSMDIDYPYNHLALDGYILYKEYTSSED